MNQRNKNNCPPGFFDDSEEQFLCMAEEARRAMESAFSVLPTATEAANNLYEAFGRYGIELKGNSNGL